jgi:hypothetical protein
MFVNQKQDNLSRTGAQLIKQLFQMYASEDLMDYDELANLISTAIQEDVDITSSEFYRFLEDFDPIKKGYITCGDLKIFFLNQTKCDFRAHIVAKNFKNFKLLDQLKDFDTQKIDTRSLNSRLWLQKATLELITPDFADLFLNFIELRENSVLIANEEVSCGYQLPLLLGKKKRVIKIKRKRFSSWCLSVIIKN